MKSMLSMVTPRLAGIDRPSFCQVMKTGWSPDMTTQGMKTRWPMENRGNSNGWMVGGTVEETAALSHMGEVILQHYDLCLFYQANLVLHNQALSSRNEGNILLPLST